ncbi:hypothetical protein DPMN_101188 [Dreissena polymorpha]|uniref:Uncharacterized protein n=1 Tax=Dreissena polymorpha TaxID=45954 RepID=A0A9D4LH52_DREPO|nr:hypothetical protein DPMN_101188 [Dreissena polymorpha]
MNNTLPEFKKSINERHRHKIGVCIFKFAFEDQKASVFLRFKIGGKINFPKDGQDKVTQCSCYPRILDIINN